MITVKLSGGTWNGVPVIAAKDEGGEVRALISVFIPQEEEKNIMLALRVDETIYDLEAKRDADIQVSFEQLLNLADLTLRESCEGCENCTCNEK